MRSHLTAIRVLCGDPVADTAEAAWAGLTRACHHHAFQLTPSEVDHLIGLVQKLAAPPAENPGTPGSATPG